MNIISSIVAFLLLFSFGTNAQELRIYDLIDYEKSKTENVAFVSLSDSYPLSENPDSLAVPDIESRGIENSTYFTLDEIYRENFLSRTQISEKDKVFIYDYSADILMSFPVKELNVTALLSDYTSEEEFPYTQYDYRIGFEIDKKLLKGFSEYYAYTLVYVGKENPFVRGQMKPVLWKKTNAENIPFGALSTEDSEWIGEYVTGDAYSCESDGFSFNVLELRRDEELVARRLLVTNSKTKEPVCERVYVNSEGGSGQPLNFTDRDENEWIYQWTGNLFKDKPPVIFGFQYLSFGCPEITFLDSKENDLIFNCDNRH